MRQRETQIHRQIDQEKDDKGQCQSNREAESDEKKKKSKKVSLSVCV